MTKQENIKKTFSILNSLQEALHLSCSNLRGFIFRTFILFVIIALNIILLELLPNKGIFFNILKEILHLFIEGIVGISITEMNLTLIDKEKFRFKKMRLKYLFPYIVASFIYYLSAFLGLLCFIIPGIMIMIRFSFWGFYVVDRDLRPVEAMKKSWNTTKGCSWKLFFFHLTSILGMSAALIFLIEAEMPLSHFTLLISITYYSLFGVLIFMAYLIFFATALIYRSLDQQTYPEERKELKVIPKGNIKLAF